MSLSTFPHPHTANSFPRVSGDEPGNFDGNFFGVEFSPRERG